MKQTLKNLSVFVPVLIFIVIAQVKELFSNHEPYKEWYRLSVVLNNAAAKGYKNSAFFIGNSATYTAVDPGALNNGKKPEYFNFSRGGASSIELMLWLMKHNVYPAKVFPELNSRDFRKNYVGDFDIIKTESEESFDIFKARVEIELRHYFERIFPFLMYRVSPEKAVKEFMDTRSVAETLKYILFPVNLNPYLRKYHSNGFYEDNKYFSGEEKAEMKKKYISYYENLMKENKEFTRSSADIMKNLSGKFTKKGTEIVFLRLPKIREIIELENLHTGGFYRECAELSEKDPHIRMLDLSKPEYLKRFTQKLTDGVHWSSDGASEISKFIDNRINGKNKSVQ